MTRVGIFLFLYLSMPQVMRIASREQVSTAIASVGVSAANVEGGVEIHRLTLRNSVPIALRQALVRCDLAK